MKERIQKLMAQANVGSRRAAEELIRQGRVRVNGKVAQLGDQADPSTDVIEVDGEKLKFDTQKRYFAINKPLNVVSSNMPQDERETVRDLIPYEGHLFTIGRLDAESDGLMILTNDGEMANKLTHPRFEHTKTYKVVVYGSPTQATLDQWERGVYLEEGLTAPCSIRVQQRESGVTVLRIVMIEGKKRQIRRVATLLDHPVKRLTRIRIGKLELGTLQPGEWYELTPEEIELMQTPGSDLSYIRRLRREQREIKRRDFLARQQGQATDERPARGFARPRGEEQSEERPPRRSDRPRSGDRNGREERPPRRFDHPRDGDRTERDDRPPRRSDRPRNGDRTESGDRPPRRFDRPRDGDRTERDDRPPRRSDRPRSGDRTEREERPPRRFDRPGNGERTESGDRPPRRSDRPRSGDRTEREERPAREDFSQGEERRERFKRQGSDDKPRRPGGRPSGRPTGRPTSRPSGRKPGGNSSSNNRSKPPRKGGDKRRNDR
jgi:23S rRNA pseudouridine2605 synthase